jgi:hypothetical protein
MDFVDVVCDASVLEIHTSFLHFPTRHGRELCYIVSSSSCAGAGATFRGYVKGKHGENITGFGLRFPESAEDGFDCTFLDARVIVRRQNITSQPFDSMVDYGLLD